MKSPYLFFLLAIWGLFMIVGIAGQVQAQTEDDQQQPDNAAVEGVEGEEREVELEAPITAEPARPLIQFTYSRPMVNFPDITVGQRTRDFFSELRKGSSMEVGPPVLDLLGLFPGLMPEFKQ